MVIIEKRMNSLLFNYTDLFLIFQRQKLKPVNIIGRTLTSKTKMSVM